MRRTHVLMYFICRMAEVGLTDAWVRLEEWETGISIIINKASLHWASQPLAAIEKNSWPQEDSTATKFLPERKPVKKRMCRLWLFIESSPPEPSHINWFNNYSKFWNYLCFQDIPALVMTCLASAPLPVAATTEATSSCVYWIFWQHGPVF